MPDGGFFVTWFDQAGVRPRIQGQYFDVDRVWLGDRCGAGSSRSTSSRALGAPAAAALTDGRVAVVWESGDRRGLGDDAWHRVPGSWIRPMYVQWLSGWAAQRACSRRGAPLLPGGGVGAGGGGGELDTGACHRRQETGCWSRTCSLPPVSQRRTSTSGPGRSIRMWRSRRSGSDGRVCFQNSVHAGVDLVADQLGWFQIGSLRAATSVRLVDTRIGLGGAAIGSLGAAVLRGQAVEATRRS